MARKNPDGRTMHARTSHAQATQSTCTYTELKLYQLCLAPCKLARQKCNGIKTAKEDFKENPSFDHSIILSIDTCRRFFLILYNITGHMLFCCHSNQWLMLQMIIHSDTDVRATFRHKNILYRHSSSTLITKKISKLHLKMSGWGTSTLAIRAQFAFTPYLKSDISFPRVFTISSLQI